MRLARIRSGWIVILIAACAVVSACALKKPPLTADATGSVSATAIVVSEPSTENPLPSSKLSASDKEGDLLTYLGSTAPIFTYNSENDVLLAYCYRSNSSHLPYDLSSGVPADGSEHPVYIPDLGIDAWIYFDSGFEIWRVSTSVPGTPTTESIVYMDDPAITAETENLRREVLIGTTPRYYSVENGLYYSYDGKAKEISVDLNGDGTEEKIVFEKSADHTNGTSDFSIRINGESVAELLKVNSMDGASKTDVFSDDDFKEIAFEYRDASGKPTTLLLRYDGNSIRTAVFPAWIDCTGDGTVLLRDEQGEVSTDKYTADQWFHFATPINSSEPGDTEGGG